MSKIKIFNLKLSTDEFNTEELDDFVEQVKVLNVWEHMLIEKNLWVILIRYEENQYQLSNKKDYTYQKSIIDKSNQYESLNKEEKERFDRLKQWRKAQVQDSSRPAYSVFNDQILYEISKKNPITLTDLKSIKGIGDHKLSQYGESLLKTLTTELNQ
jgi:superfamily II DNA helicase RecQ